MASTNKAAKAKPASLKAKLRAWKHLFTPKPLMQLYGFDLFSSHLASISAPTPLPTVRIDNSFHLETWAQE
ncbi:hypothetical protein DSO57_1020174 [Entomophthora muscae]|uniref:Uncharacterized protein n=1 Tax=Entomophthora muscae TaxID=34485 RepID=A0ACC2S5Z3_9FUNG|nr:hypothetical protein DSO57_1020174 [Entomophthora muscae]